MAEAGAGVDAGLIRQSAVAAELDALNIRYGGEIEAQGLLSKAKSLKRNSRLLAGAKLLSGVSSAYSTGRT
jgi:hypothetical protein